MGERFSVENLNQKFHLFHCFMIIYSALNNTARHLTTEQDSVLIFMVPREKLFIDIIDAHHHFPFGGLIKDKIKDSIVQYLIAILN